MSGWWVALWCGLASLWCLTAGLVGGVMLGYELRKREEKGRDGR